MAATQLDELPDAALEHILWCLELRDRIAISSISKRLKSVASSSNSLWERQHVDIAAGKLPKLVAWLYAHAPTFKSLSVHVTETRSMSELRVHQEADGRSSLRLVSYLEELLSSLKGAAQLTSLVLAFGLPGSNAADMHLPGSSWHLPQLRELSIHAPGGRLDVDVKLSQLTQLTALELGAGCYPLPRWELPATLCQLDMPVDIGAPMVGGWDCSLSTAQRLHDLRAVCRWVAMDEVALDDLGEVMDDVMDDYYAQASTLDLGPLGGLFPQLQSLTVDCGQASGGGGREVRLTGGEGLPPALRSLTATHLGHASLDLLRALPALRHLTRLRLPHCRLELQLEHATVPHLPALLSPPLSQPLTRLSLTLHQATAAAEQLPALTSLSQLDLHLPLPLPSSSPSPSCTPTQHCVARHSAARYFAPLPLQRSSWLPPALPSWGTPPPRQQEPTPSWECSHGPPPTCCGCRHLWRQGGAEKEAQGGDVLGALSHLAAVVLCRMGGLQVVGVAGDRCHPRGCGSRGDGDGWEQVWGALQEGFSCRGRGSGSQLRVVQLR